ncbi:MAG: FadR/GntR family transcriptional regulator [Paracoccaceae bacterium]
MNSNLTFKYGANDIAAQLRRDINSGILQRFERLPPERSLSLKFNVSRGTIRAAINKLETEGLVTTKAGSGTYISKKIAGENSSVIQNARPLELVDARFALEPHICRLAVVHGRKKDFEKLNNLLEEMEKNYYNPNIFGDTDTSFHRALAESTGNSLLIWMIEQITSVRNQDEWSRMRHLTLNEQIIKEYNKQHRRILNAINAREPENAASMMPATANIFRQPAYP